MRRRYSLVGFTETSAKTNINLHELFFQVAQTLLDRYRALPPSTAAVPKSCPPPPANILSSSATMKSYLMDDDPRMAAMKDRQFVHKVGARVDCAVLAMNALEVPVCVRVCVCVFVFTTGPVWVTTLAYVFTAKVRGACECAHHPETWGRNS